MSNKDNKDKIPIILEWDKKSLNLIPLDKKKYLNSFLLFNKKKSYISK